MKIWVVVLGQRDAAAGAGAVDGGCRAMVSKVDRGILLLGEGSRPDDAAGLSGTAPDAAHRELRNALELRLRLAGYSPDRARRVGCSPPRQGSTASTTSRAPLRARSASPFE